ncbi:MAG: type secretion system protein ImpM [Betaproteobacteria bacterium]|jgi:type VI secretion system protein ImpM|nr:type secretion system protein ImpM [Betaproteobacteria bacterium]
MEAHGSAPLIAGWYGKMPCLGDFASRRLDSGFIAAWDSWLQRSLAASRQALADSWLETFLRSPMWRFVLTPGVCGADAWTGLLVPSVDKVGRYFPMTFALRVPAANTDITSLFAARTWYQALEQVGLLALSADFSPEALETALAGLPFPAVFESSDAASAAMLSWWRNPGGAPQSLQLSDGVPLSAAIDRSASGLVTHAAAGRTLWWSVEPHAGTTEVHCANGLPPDTYFEVLLRGVDEKPDVDVQVLQI